MKEAAFVYESC